MTDPFSIVVPDLGDFDSVEVIEVLVKPGDRLQVEDGIVTLESDKASMDVPATHAGVVAEVLVAVGDSVSAGTPLVTLEGQRSDAEPVEPAAAAPTPPTPPTPAGPVQVVVPDIGDFDAVEVIEILVAPGDVIAAEDGVVTLESDKASMDVPSPHDGRVAAVLVAVGDSVAMGSPLIELETDALDSRAAEELVVEEGQLAPGEPREVGVFVPDLGDFDEVEVIEVLVAPGDQIEEEQGLVTLESDKATMDVPATDSGTLVSIAVAVGDKVSSGSLVATLTTRGDAPEEAPTRIQPRPPLPESPPDTPSPPPAVPQPTQQTGQLPAIDEAGFSKAHASPSVRKFARELGADLGRIKGTGRKSRITVEDVKAFVKGVLSGAEAGTGAALPKVPSVDFTKFGPVEVEPLSRIQRISGPRLHASWVNLPHVTQFDVADVTETEATRKGLKAKADERGIKLTPLAFIVRAVVLALAEFPKLASSLAADGKSLVMKHYRHIGFAADTPSGLVVPVIQDADNKDIYELAQALTDLSGKARAGQLSPADMQGGVFTISSLGGIGGTSFTPVINAPEVAILGVSKMQTQPVYREGAFVPRLVCTYL